MVTLTPLVLLIIYHYLGLRSRVTHLREELKVLKSTHEEMLGEAQRVVQTPLPDQFVDPLTRLPMLKIFEDRVNQAIHHSTRQKVLFAVVALEVDSFEELKRRGDNVANTILKEFSNRLQMSIRQVDTLARFAEGHFLLFLPHLSRPETAIYVAQRIQDNLIQHFLVGKEEIKITASMGIAVYPIDGGDVKTLVSSAEAALKQAMVNGKNTYQFYQSELHSLGERELEIAKLIRSPQLLNHLVIQYKTYFNAITNTPFYIQATPHLKHPKLGMIPFSKFSVIAENSGKMLEINEWLVRSALEQAHKWQEVKFESTYLAIQIPLKQLENPHFIFKITEILNASNMQSTKMVLEIINDNWEQNIIFLDKLFSNIRDAQIKICMSILALSHFAISKIKSIPIDFIKLDEKLIQSMSAVKNKDEILKNMIDLARDENILVMADGVDDEKTRTNLTAIGCEVMQGKSFGYLMPTGAVIKDET